MQTFKINNLFHLCVIFFVGQIPDLRVERDYIRAVVARWEKLQRVSIYLC